jgi:hypothetical protein
LPFEKEPLGENIAAVGNENFYFFGAQEADACCKDLGFSIFGDEANEPEWVILKVKRKLFGLFGN